MMKNFLRSTVGKFLLFFTFILAGTVAAGCILAAAYMIEEDAYKTSETAYINEINEMRAVNANRDFVIQSVLAGELKELFGIECEACMLDDTNRVITKTLHFDGAGVRKDTEQFELPVTVFLQNQKVTRILLSDVPVYDQPEVPPEPEYTVPDVSFEEELYEESADSFSGPEEESLAETVYLEARNYRLITYLEKKDLLSEGSTERKMIRLMYSLRFYVYPVGLLMLTLAALSYVALIRLAGLKPHSEEVARGPLFRVPFDLLLAAALFIVLSLLGLVFGTGKVIWSGQPFFLICLQSGCIIAAVCAFLGLSMSCAARVKQHALVKNTVICRILRLLLRGVRFIGRRLKKLYARIRELITGLPLIWKTALILLGITFLEGIALLEFMGFGYEPDCLILCWIIEKAVLIPAVLFAALTFRRLEMAGKKLADGDFSYRTDTGNMFGLFKKHAEDLNRASAGMTEAVEERLKSERMKTELITNVSHDLKTPLTSLINYSDLIQNEPCENEKIRSYAEVLNRQSVKMKRLIEDLIEASKAATGNLEVTPEPLNAAVFIAQAMGEFSERLQDAGLTPVSRLPEKEIRILADSRRMWRIFDNLLSNICKYSCPGTRVFLELMQQGTEAVFTFRNTSKEELTLTGEELSERFVRADLSRTTEGNGLGLPIAKSLTELQGGAFSIQTDGDLFKVVLRFPVFTEENQAG